MTLPLITSHIPDQSQSGYTYRVTLAFVKFNTFEVSAHHYPNDKEPSNQFFTAHFADFKAAKRAYNRQVNKIL